MNLLQLKYGVMFAMKRSAPIAAARARLAGELRRARKADPKMTRRLFRVMVRARRRLINDYVEDGWWGIAGLIGSSSDETKH